MNNLDKDTVKCFGDEWSKFDQSKMPDEEKERIFRKYFSLFPLNDLNKNSEGFDMGCGTGRWAYFVASKVGKLHCIDPSDALNVAKTSLKKFNNIEFHDSSVDSTNIQEESQDFGYSLGVLHHVPDTQEAIKSCSKLLKKGAPLLLYLYYSFDNKPTWFYLVWKITDLIRKIISRLPSKVKNIVTDIIALIIYLPFSKLSFIFDKLNINTSKVPLSFYKDKSFYTMRTDSRDRFGTILEKRFSKLQIKEMMERANLQNIKFSDQEPFWCAIGYKK